MPLYEYECDKCKEISEFLLKISDPHPDSCPRCGHSKLTKLLSRTSFVLKGTGWYETDFKSNKDRNSKTGAAPASNSDKGTASETSQTTASEKPASSEPTAAPSSSETPAAAKSATKPAET